MHRNYTSYFFDLRKQFSQTFLIVTHNEELARMSDRILHMKDGRIVLSRNGGIMQLLCNIYVLGLHGVSSAFS